MLAAHRVDVLIVDLGVVMCDFEHIDFTHDLDDYASIAGLPPALAELRNEAVQTARQFAGRRLVMISAEDARGSLVENIPAQVALLRACGIQAEWLRFAPTPEQKLLHRRLHDLSHSGIGCSCPQGIPAGHAQLKTGIGD